jgi:hypothetical protein
VPGNQHFVAVQRHIQQPREVALGVMNVELGHRFRLALIRGYRQAMNLREIGGAILCVPGPRHQASCYHKSNWGSLLVFRHFSVKNVKHF